MSSTEPSSSPPLASPFAASFARVNLSNAVNCAGPIFLRSISIYSNSPATAWPARVMPAAILFDSSQSSRFRFRRISAADRFPSAISRSPTPSGRICISRSISPFSITSSSASRIVAMFPSPAGARPSLCSPSNPGPAWPSKIPSFAIYLLMSKPFSSTASDRPTNISASPSTNVSNWSALSAPTGAAYRVAPKSGFPYLRFLQFPQIPRPPPHPDNILSVTLQFARSQNFRRPGV